MTDEIQVLPVAETEQSLVTDVPDGVVTVPSVGQQLRTAREAKQLSATDVAQTLKLSVRQVHALEADDWSSLPGTTISRGFIRNYARLLNLNSEALMSQLDIVRMPPPPELDRMAGISAAMPRTGKVERRDWTVIFSGLLLVVLALLAYFFVPHDFFQSKLSNLTAEANVEVTATEKGDSLQSSPGSDQTVPLVVPADSEAALSDKASAASGHDALSTTNSAASVGGLKLSFSRPSWVEIRDQSGQIIFSQLNAAGSQREIEGQPPFALIIGNASGVTVEYKGKTVDLALRSKDDVARLNLE